MSTDVQVFDRLLEIALLLQHDLARSFAGTGLTTARTHLLWELSALGPSTQQALAVALGVSPRNITGLVDALQEHGYVTRRPHPTDRRALLVTLTEAGEQTIAQMQAGRTEAAAELVSGLAPDRLEEFRATLDTVAERLRHLVEVAAAEPGAQP